MGVVFPTVVESFSPFPKIRGSLGRMELGSNPLIKNKHLFIMVWQKYFDIPI